MSCVIPKNVTLSSVRIVHNCPVLNDKTDSPMIYAEEVVQIGPEDGRSAGSGFTDYDESEQESGSS